MEHNDTIWTIDDDEVALFVNKALLKSHGFVNIVAFNNPLDALSDLKRLDSRSSQFPKFILLDINMLEMNGFELIEAVAQEKVNMANTTILILSSSIEIIDQISAYTLSIPVTNYLKSH